MAMAIVADVSAPGHFPFLSLPLELRREVYKLIFFRPEIHGCTIFTTKSRSSGRTYYRLLPGPPYVEYYTNPYTFFRVNRQIYYEAREVVYTNPLPLYIDHRNIEYAKGRALALASGRCKRLYPLFKNMRKVAICIGYMDWNDMFWTETLLSSHREMRNRLNRLISSLVPRPPFESQTALTSVTLYTEVGGWVPDESEAPKLFWMVMDPLITIMPAKVDVQLGVEYWTCGESDSHHKARMRFGDHLRTEFARKRAEYVASVSVTADAVKQGKGRESSKDRLQDLGDVGPEASRKDEEEDTEKVWESFSSEED